MRCQRLQKVLAERRLDQKWDGYKDTAKPKVKLPSPTPAKQATSKTLRVADLVDAQHANMDYMTEN